MDFYFGRLSDWLERDFSLADIAYPPHFAAIAEGNAFDFSSTPNVRAWLDRMWARPAWKKATEMAFGGDGGYHHPTEESR